MSNKSMAGNSSSSSSRSCCCCCYMLLLLLCMLLPAMPNAAAAAATRRARITASHNATTLTETKLKTSTDGSNSNNNNNNSNSNNIADSKYEIRGVAGEPNYKSVNLTWEVEFVTSAHDTDTKRNANTNTNTNTIVNVDGVTNMSVGGVDVEPPKAFQIFYCEIQNYGAQRCRVKLVNATAATVAATDVATNELLTTQQAEDHVDSSHVQHFAAAVDNLRMATRYSFHIRPVQSRRLRSSSARSELFNAEDNEIEGATATHLPGQSIVIPTKGFSAHATQCLAHASEIEVETGPYFGGLIVVDGGDCGIKGNPNDPADKYTMRIDHKQCGSMVKPETNTVETFITVQENLGIFTHSTRRFVVVCSYQSGMQTVRASFTVPGKNGVAAAIESNDPFQPDDERLGREMRNMRFVNKSELVLKGEDSEELPALVMETSPPEKPKQEQLTQAKEPKEQQQQRMQGRALSLASLNELNSLAVRDVESVEPPAQLSTKYAKLVVEQGTADANEANANDDDDDEFYVASLRYISANLGSVLVTVSISVIIISICIVLLLQQRHRLPNYNYNNSNNQQRNSNNNKLQSHLAKLGCPAAAHLPHKTLPRALQQQYQCTL